MPTAPFVIMTAPNGARKTKADHPELPITPTELGRTAAECREAGAAAIHLHVRDRDGRHSLDAAAYRAATQAVRAAVGEELIVQITTEAVGRYRPAEQMACVRAVRPEAVSLSVRELSAHDGGEAELAAFFQWIQSEKIHPQWILYDADDVRLFEAWRSRGVVPCRPAFLLFVLGRYGDAEIADPTMLMLFLRAFDPTDHWAVCAFGRTEYASALTAAALGGHSRVGFENNTELPDGGTARNNAVLVRYAADAAAIAGRSVADAQQARTFLFREP